MNTLVLVGYILAILAGASRLLPFTKPFWSLFPKAVQAVLPSIVAAVPVAISAFTTVKTPMDLFIAVLIVGALFVPGARDSHGDQLPPAAPPGKSVVFPRDPKPPSFPPPMAAMVGLLLACLLLGGCALFESRLPAAEACAPTPAELATQVAAILTAGGDYASALEQLALKDTEAAVICAVEAFLSNDKMSATPTNSAAKERARAYLASKGAK